MARRSRYLTASQRRKRSQDRIGLAIIAATLGAFFLMLYGAYKIDQAHGITVCESLAAHGIGRC